MGAGKYRTSPSLSEMTLTSLLTLYHHVCFIGTLEYNLILLIQSNANKNRYVVSAVSFVNYAIYIVQLL